jgi:hypothetical protein
MSSWLNITLINKKEKVVLNGKILLISLLNHYLKLIIKHKIILKGEGIRHKVLLKKLVKVVIH